MFLQIVYQFSQNYLFKKIKEKKPSVLNWRYDN